MQGSFIGLQSNGTTVAGNRGDGVRINASSHGDLIGRIDPVTSTNYYPTQYVYTSDGTSMPVSGWQGIRAAGTAGQYLITGTSTATACCTSGRSPARAARRIPSITRRLRRRASTAPTFSATASIGWSEATRPAVVKPRVSSFRGRLADLSNSSNYRTIDDGNPNYTYVHSTMGDLAVGNAGDVAASTDHAFLYSVSQDYDPDPHRLSGLDNDLSLRHLVQRRHELYDLRWL